MTDHFDGERFFNPGIHFQDHPFSNVLKWKLKGTRRPWPKTAPSPFQDKPPARCEGMRVTLIGHASVLIQISGCNILIDPVWSKRASPFSFAGPMRFNAPGIAFDDLPPIDAVLITHNHYDHLDIVTLRALWAAFRPKIIAPLGNDVIIRRRDGGIEVHSGDWGETVELSPSVSATLHPAYHWSSRWLHDRRKALWCGYVLQSPAGILYASGDTGYGEGSFFKAVPERFGPPDVALLPLGAYEPRWFMHPQHADPSQAVKILQDCQAQMALGIHWGTFRLSDEGWDEPLKDLETAIAEAGIAEEKFIPMRPGQVWLR